MGIITGEGKGVYERKARKFICEYCSKSFKATSTRTAKFCCPEHREKARWEQEKKAGGRKSKTKTSSRKPKTSRKREG